MRLTITLCLLLLSGNVLAQAPSIPLYNDLQTEGYNGNVKHVTITNTSDAVYEEDGKTLKSYTTKDIMYMSFNRNKFLTSVATYFEVDGTYQLYDSSAYTYADFKNYSVESYNADRERISSSVVTWVNDRKMVTEKYDNNIEHIETETRTLNKKYKILSLETKYLTPSGNVKKRKISKSKYNDLGNLTQMTYDVYDEHDKIIKERHVVLKVKVLERDKNNNPTHSSSIIKAITDGTLDMHIEYKYYE